MCVLCVQVGQQSVVDLSTEEEPCATAALRIAVNAAGRVMGISKAGSGGIDPTLTQVRSTQRLTGQVMPSWIFRPQADYSSKGCGFRHKLQTDLGCVGGAAAWAVCVMSGIAAGAQAQVSSCLPGMWTDN